jgi:gamma-D-glutamyl-L-lysine dipeptidyl-peptidase
MKGIASKTVVPVYGKPEDNSSLTDELLYGMMVTVLEQKVPLSDKWIYILTEYQYTGYVRKKDFILEDEKIFQAWEATPKRRVMQGYADVLSESRVQGVIQMEITRGGLIAYLGPVMQEQAGWAKVMLADGRCGYMKDNYLEELRTTKDFSEDKLRQQVVETAKQYLGTQYRWGGKSPLGIDCSGLTSVAYLINGILTYRDAKIVEGFPVHEIHFEDRKPGDLLYFKGHIAMLIDERRYIHATARLRSEGVVINSLFPEDDNYREDLAKGLLAVGSVF